MTNFLNSTTLSAVTPATAARGRAVPLDFHRVNSELGGRFTLLKPLSVCDAAMTYLAREAASGRTVELRVIAAGDATDAQLTELFRLEQEAAETLAHERILKGGGTERRNGLYLGVTESDATCRNLADLLEQYGWLAPQRAVEIILQIAALLDYAHQRGVLHLQLHPANVLLSADGRVKLKGFGVKAGEQFDWAHQLRSEQTPAAYLSPEQAGGGRLDHATDIYALGVLFYQMLTDRVPFDSESRESVIRKKTAQMPLPPHRISLFVPKAISETVMGLLERERIDRYCDPGKLHAALRNLLTAQPRTAQPSPATAAPAKANDAAQPSAARAAVAEEQQPPKGVKATASEIKANADAVSETPAAQPVEAKQAEPISAPATASAAEASAADSWLSRLRRFWQREPEAAR